MKKMIIILMILAVLLTGPAACGINEKTDDNTSAPAETTQTDAAADLTQTEENTENEATEDGQTDGEAVTIRLSGSGAEAANENVSVSGTDVLITGAGTYLLTGTLENGSVIVDADKDDTVELVLAGVSIRAETFAAVYVKQADEVRITLAEGTENTLSNGGSFTQRDDNKVDAVIFAKDDVTLDGAGTLTVSSPAGHGIVGKDEITITGGVYEITAAKCAVRANDGILISDGTLTLTAGTDGLHAENNDDDTLGNITVTGGTLTINVADDGVHANTLLQIDGGTFDITAAEGLEATYVKINNGDITISASDDGVNAAQKSSAYTPTVEINGGTLTIVMGAGDTDGVDSNGNIIVTGGYIDITGQSSFDYDGTAQYTGGVIIVNGQQVSSIPNQFMGGMGGMGGMPGAPRR